MTQFKVVWVPEVQMDFVFVLNTNVSSCGLKED